MDRKVLIALLRNGMRYRVGKHQVWVSRCFEITVHPNKVVEVDEYEGYAQRRRLKIRRDSHVDSKNHAGMFHIGKSVISLKDREIIEDTSGTGWVRPVQSKNGRC